jgi:Spx/MgsR family transcriptional regulator
MITLYGIKNCDTVKKARKWLDTHNVEYTFHDFRQDGLDKALLNKWVKELGWEILINRRGTTWRKLDENIRERIGKSSAIKIMLEQPAIIKRPVLDLGNKRHVGFKESEYQDLLG